MPISLGLAWPVYRGSNYGTHRWSPGILLGSCVRRAGRWAALLLLLSWAVSSHAGAVVVTEGAGVKAVPAATTVGDAQIVVDRNANTVDAQALALLQTWADRLRANIGDRLILEIKVGAAGSRSLALAVADGCLDSVRETLARMGVALNQIRRSRVLVDDDPAAVTAVAERKPLVVRLIYEAAPRR